MKKSILTIAGLGLAFFFAACGTTQKSVAIPGTSEHHTGLAIDIVPKVDGEWKWENEDMMNLPELFAIIHKELPKHGFILRYPKNKEETTGYSYEPWHIRYVASKKIAQKIFDEGITLEKYKGEK
ncbi:MAG: M15 family metallopeptidase [Treponema sp.]|nr:M15 family metallopeptidase [Treponema sp.]